MKLNNKGLTLIEVLASLVLLSIIITIAVPSVSYIVSINKKNNYEFLEKGIISATKIYISDNRYNITLEKTCTTYDDEITITYINGIEIDSKLPIYLLIDSNNLKTIKKDGNIPNPLNNDQILDLNNSYVSIKYNCNKKDYTCSLGENSLKWIKK